MQTPNDYRTAGFLIGCQAWTFNRFTVFEAIEKTALTGGRVIEMFPGQKLSVDDPAGFDHNASAERRARVQEKLKKHDIRAVNYGVVGLGMNESENRKVFEFAKAMSIPCVTSEPDVRSFDLLEKLVKEYDVRLAIHDHPKKANDPNYRYWDPNFVLSIVKDRDKRIGACADTGHWVRSGVKPVDALRILRGRVLSSHLKDLNRYAPNAEEVPYGTGVSDIAAILTELKAQRFDGNISIEYENNWENNVPHVAQCIGFVRGFAAR